MSNYQKVYITNWRRCDTSTATCSPCSAAILLSNCLLVKASKSTGLIPLKCLETCGWKPRTKLYVLFNRPKIVLKSLLPTWILSEVLPNLEPPSLGDQIANGQTWPGKWVKRSPFGSQKHDPIIQK